MGSRVSWLAAQGLARDDLLARLGLRDTGVPDEANEAPFSCAQLPTGWTNLSSNDCTWEDEEKGAPVGRGAPTLTCALHEGVMWSEAAAYSAAGRLWHVLHDSARSRADVDASGALPQAFAAIRDAARRGQAEAGPSADVDFLFDVPVDLARAITGWRHDLCDFAWGAAQFTEAVPIAGAA